MKVTLTVTKGPHQGQAFCFEEHDNFIVGRAKCAHFRLPLKDKYFSRIHFMVEVNPPHCRLMDMGSTNGTLVNGRKVKTADLKDADLIKGGQTTIRVALDRSDAEEARDLGPSPSKPTGPLRPAAAERIGNAAPPGNRAGAGKRPAAEPGKALEPTLLPQPVRSEVPTCLVCGAALRPGENDGTIGQAQRRLALLCKDCCARIEREVSPIAGYQIVRELGRGGMGIVYLAIRDADGAFVALKVIKPSVRPSRKDLERFLREASILQSLAHPNIVAFLDQGESDGYPYFAMEYVSGRDAACLLREESAPLAVDRAVGIACQLLEALASAHAQRFVHRDIKPANLLVARVAGREVAKLADFGLARVYQTSRISGLTLLNDVGGSPAFMAPEQITNYRDALPSTDLYAVGATLYHLLTRKFIYDYPSSIDAKFTMILQDDPIPIGERRSDLPTGLAEVIHRALARKIADRFASAEEMRKALLSFAT